MFSNVYNYRWLKLLGSAYILQISLNVVNYPENEERQQ